MEQYPQAKGKPALACPSKTVELEHYNASG